MNFQAKACSDMNSSLLLKVGIFRLLGEIPECALSLERLIPNEDCPNIGATSDLLGKALAIAGVPYSLVSLELGEDGSGHFDETTGKWTGPLITVVTISFC